MALSAPRFRANPDWIATAAGEYRDTDGMWGSGLAGPGTVAFLGTRDGQHGIAADFETAALFETLRVAGPLPDYMRRLPRPQRELMVARLVWDGALEVESEGGSFVRGARARHSGVGPTELSGNRTADHVDELSLGAIRHAARRAPVSDIATARRLYMSNTFPRTSAWFRFAGDEARLADLFRLGSEGRLRSSRYTEHGSRSAQDPWLHWVRRGTVSRASLRHKIYVSPTPRGLIDSFGRAADVCTAMDVPALKVASTAERMLRPDKLVIHLRSEEEMWAVAAELGTALRGVEAQGVPFTARIDDAGLISWAIDPDGGSRVATTGRPQSWRMRIALLLARAIAEARDAAGEDEQIDFALDRARLEGIEPVGWRAPEHW